MVKNVRIAEKALGKIHHGLTEEEKKNKVFIRSIFVVNDIKKGEIFSKDNVRPVRPGYGLAPKYMRRILGKKAKRNVKKGTPLNWDLIG